MGDFTLGLIIVAIAVGCLTSAAYGWLVLGGGLMVVGLVQYLDGPFRHNDRG